MLKSYRVVVVAHEILVSAQGPLVLGFWVWDFGDWGLGLTIIILTFSPDEIHFSNIIGPSVLTNCIQFEKLPLALEFIQSFRDSVTSDVLSTKAPQISGNCLSKSV